MSLSIMTQTATLRDLLENLFDSSYPVEHPAFSSETSLFHFAEAGVTPIGGRSQVDLFVCTITSSRIQIFFYKSGIISSRWHPWWELDVLTFNDKLIARRRIGGIKNIMPPGSATLSPPQTSSRLASLADFFFFRHADFFSFSHHAEPGPRLIQIKYWKNLVTANNL